MMNDVAQTAAARCTVGLLTWNAGEAGPACARALLAQDEPRLGVDWIDNGSADATPARLRAACPALPEPEINNANIGFCAAHNRMLARCRTRYYLALNQDVVLAPDYARRLCDWMDAEPDLTLAAGVTLRAPADPRAPRGDATVDSAGMVFPRARYHFHLGMGRPYAALLPGRRRVAGLEGAALLMRVEACRAAAVPGEGVFPESFFAYYEEVDLEHRLARLAMRTPGAACPFGLDPAALATHAGKGSGGFARSRIRARFLANHWLITLRNDPAGSILRELPWIVRGELQYWLREYASAPGAALRALATLAREAPAARRAFRAFEAAHPGPNPVGLARLRALARASLRA